MWQAGFVAMSGPKRVSFLEGIGALPGYSCVNDVQPDDDAPVEFEFPLAANSRSCSDDDRFDQVQFELETEFVEAHADQPALIAAGDA